MDTVAVNQALKTPRAVLACLAMILLLSDARAQDFGASAAVGPQSFAPLGPVQGEATSTQADPPLQDLPTPGNTMAPPDKVIVDPAASPQPAQWPTAGPPARKSDQWRIWRFFPLGMVPYIGPRTPDDQKDRGIGQPLDGNGWRTQLFSISPFAGVTDGGALIPGRVMQQPSFYGGVNIGWDYDHYWGFEKRLGFGALHLTNGAGQSIPETGLSVTGEYRLMYYPLGDARWRPFLTAGIGWSDFYFNDDRGVAHLDTLGVIPFGVGLKYLQSDRLAFRMDLIDEMTFGNSLLANFQYVALTAGLEFRYGKRLLNLPWHHKDGS